MDGALNRNRNTKILERDNFLGLFIIPKKVIVFSVLPKYIAHILQPNWSFSKFVITYHPNIIQKCECTEATDIKYFLVTIEHSWVKHF